MTKPTKLGRPSFAKVLASMPNVGEDADFAREQGISLPETARRDLGFTHELAVALGCTHVTNPGDNIFIDLGFPPEEAEQLLEESKRRIEAARKQIGERDSKRDVGGEFLETIGGVKAGNVGAMQGPPGTLLLRCINLAPLGELSGDDLVVGELYLGRAEGDAGWVRVIDGSGEDYLYPRACFEEVKPLSGG